LVSNGSFCLGGRVIVMLGRWRQLVSGNDGSGTIEEYPGFQGKSAVTRAQDWALGHWESTGDELRLFMQKFSRTSVRSSAKNKACIMPFAKWLST
jgi:hypothetical protein